MRSFNSSGQSNGIFKKVEYDRIIEDINKLNCLIPKIKCELGGWYIIPISSRLFRDSLYHFGGCKEYGLKVFGIFTTMKECKNAIEGRLKGK